MSTVKVTDLHLAENPEARLATCAMMAATGVHGEPNRLVVTCPDRGTTGLHAFRPNDIARMLMKHARVNEITTTEEGTIVASADLCDRRGELAIWTGQAIGPWHASDVVQRGLGGSETAAVRLAENLAAMGWTVTLYGDFEQDGLYGEVITRRYQTFDPTAPLDVLVGFRNATLFDERPNARWCGLWLEDLAPAEHLTPARAENIDRIVGVTHWHAAQIERTHPWLVDMITPEGRSLVAAGRNGIQTAWFHPEIPPEREKRVLYTSSPDRGLDVVLDVWPQVRERVPDATLIATYSRWFEQCADVFLASNQLRASILDQLERLKDHGVHRITEGVGQKALANLMMSSTVWCAPSYYTPGEAKFEETSCISAMEAQAAGCVVVASNWGALTETVQHGTLLDGDPSDPEGSWRALFVDAIVRGLTDEATQHQAQTVGPEMVRDMDWRGAAEQLASMFTPEPSYAMGGVVRPGLATWMAS